MSRLPSVFISHGGPPLALEHNATTEFFARLGKDLAAATSILSVSAHWHARRATASLASHPETIYDFGGFDPALYQMNYPAPGAPALARRAVALLTEAGIEAGLDPDHGLDHGSWIPLKMMFPRAEIPVTQLSIVHSLDPALHLEMGKALAPLRDEGVLVLGSGGAVHPLGAPGVRFGAEPEPWVQAFDDWLTDAIERNDHAALLKFGEAPGAKMAQYYPDHFMPVLVAAGAGGPGAKGRTLYRGTSMGVFTMSAYSFE
ncbi:MAG: DODA-type extradiol aromatic ring-opening family dioxygenase [Thermoplasmatota archaeon]